jgi:hypothetical protein
MGKHRTQEQKLKDAFAELNAGTSIANRDVRRILGADYAAYQQALRAARVENNQFKNPERTQAQREVEQAIKLALMHMQRGTASADSFVERATELMQQLAVQDREEMACWEHSPDTATVEIAWNDLIEGGIYRDIGAALSVDELKQDTLREFVQGVLRERFGYQTEPALDAELLRAKLAALKAEH